MSAPVALKCPSCASPLKADDVQLAQGIATCSYCRAVMTFAGPGKEPWLERPRAPIPLPPRVTLRQTMHGIEIRRRWFTPAVLFLIVFCVFWDGFLVVWYTMAFAAKGPLLMKLFPMIHVAVGVAVTYSTVASLFNSTRIAIERGEIKVSHGPVPWPGKVTLHSDQIDQLYCKEKISHGKNGPRYSYELWMLLRDGSQKKLVAAGLEKEQGLYIEQEVERTIGIKDRAVGGELPRA
jgi:hypothetical protein